jgi:hypothetical protein
MFADINDGSCHNNPCFNDGICSPNLTDPYGYTCRCKRGIDGKNCESERFNTLYIVILSHALNNATLHLFSLKVDKFDIMCCQSKRKQRI